MLVDQEDVPGANALLGFGTNVSLALGPAVAGLLATLRDVHGVLLISAFTFLFSAALLRRLPPLPPAPEAGEESTPFWASTRAGLVFLVTHPTARAVAGYNLGARGFCHRG